MKKNVFEVVGNSVLKNEVEGVVDSNGIFVSDPILLGIIKEYTETKNMNAVELVKYYCGEGKPKKAIASVLVTKDDAEKFIDSTIDFNRRIGEKNLKRIKTDMENNDWDETSDMCLFDKNGNMINAGHRMRGIFETGKSQYITIGFNYEFSPKQDRGSKRTVSQNIKMMIRLKHPKVTDIMNETIYANNIICAAVTLLLTRYGIDGSDVNNVIEYMRKNKDNIEAVAEMMFDGVYKRGDERNKGLFAAGFIASCIIANQSGIPIQQLKKFRDVWGSAGKIVDESMDGSRYDDILLFRDKIHKFGLADSNNKDAYFRDCLLHFYAAYRFKKLYGRHNNRKEVEKEMPVAFKVDYLGNELSIPWNSKYKDGRDK